jgi:hypothetical protein
VAPYTNVSCHIRTYLTIYKRIFRKPRRGAHRSARFANSACFVVRLLTKPATTRLLTAPPPPAALLSPFHQFLTSSNQTKTLQEQLRPWESTDTTFSRSGNLLCGQLLCFPLVQEHTVLVCVQFCRSSVVIYVCISPHTFVYPRIRLYTSRHVCIPIYVCISPHRFVYVKTRLYTNIHPYTPRYVCIC